jgi:hypothetical protein
MHTCLYTLAFLLPLSLLAIPPIHIPHPFDTPSTVKQEFGHIRQNTASTAPEPDSEEESEWYDTDWGWKKEDGFHLRVWKEENKNHVRLVPPVIHPETIRHYKSVKKFDDEELIDEIEKEGEKRVQDLSGESTKGLQTYTPSPLESFFKAKDELHDATESTQESSFDVGDPMIIQPVTGQKKGRGRLLGRRKRKRANRSWES